MWVCGIVCGERSLSCIKRGDHTDHQAPKHGMAPI